MEYKFLLEPGLQIASDGPGRIFGYASTFGNLDSDNDIVLPGAYAATIPQFLKKGFVAFGHDWNVPIATPYVAREDDRGLYVEAEFHSDPESQRYRTIAAERIARGLSMGLSIGYTVKDAERKDGARLLKELNLYEFSLVTVPANDEAGISTIKGVQDSRTEARRIKAAWDTAYINALEDSAFAAIEAGGKKDDSGRTTPRSLRHYPHHNASGALDLAHLRAALARIASPDNYQGGKAHLAAHAKAEEVGDYAKDLYIDEAPEGSYEDLAEDITDALTEQHLVPVGAYVCTLATYPSYAYVSVCAGDGYGMSEATYYRADYTLDADGDPVITDLSEVEPGVVFTPLEQPGLQFAGHAERVLAAVRGLAVRSTALAALRGERKAGRVLSAANHARLTAAHDGMAAHLAAMQQVLTEHAPPEKACLDATNPPARAAARAELLRFYAALPRL